MSAPIRILCIDDEARILRALKALFREHEVHVTDDPDAAVEFAVRHDIDVVVCDQRMPKRLGVEVLRTIRERHPRALRILLTGYSDLSAILASVNEGEVFRYVNKPWDNAELRQVVQTAARIAREAPVLAPELVSDGEKEAARRVGQILVIEDDAETQARLREILQPHYQVRFATSPDRALQVLEQHEIGVVISETDSGRADLTGLIKELKRHHPMIASVVLTDRANAQLAIDLINEGQVFRMLLKPVRAGSCRLSVEAALGRYWQLKQNPDAASRYVVAADAEAPREHHWVNESLLKRILALPKRWLVSPTRPKPDAEAVYY